MIHAEVDRQTDPSRLAELKSHLIRVIGEVLATVEDWGEMRRRALEVAAELRAELLPSIREEDVHEAAAFSSGSSNTITFRSRLRAVQRGRRAAARIGAGSGLGICASRAARRARAGSTSCRRACAPALEPYILNLTKANSRATVHRPAYLDYVGVKRFDDQGKVGERRHLGLYTHEAYQARPGDIPILRRKVAAVLERAGFPPGSHNEKALVEILETHLRDELFQISADELFDVAMGILHLGERQRLRLFVRRDAFGRFFSLLVFVPRDRFNIENRRRIEAILRSATGARRSTTRRACPSRCSCGCTTWPTSIPPGCRAGRPRSGDAARGGHSLLGRRPRGGALGGARGGARQSDLPPPPGRLPAGLPADWVARPP